MSGQKIGAYRVLKEIGVGGMGVVYLAQHEMIGRLAAIKLLRPELSHNQDMVTRFFNEARMAAMIKHPGLVDVYDFGRLLDGSAYIVMEYLEGETLGHMLERLGKLPIDVAVAITRQAAAAIGAAHAKGIVHRDLKPDNLFLVPDDEVAVGLRVRILDFGIAKLLGTTANGLRTRTGSLMGTPVYMSPEQCRGTGGVDHRSDVYSLACILFEMVTGRRLFDSEGLGEIIAAHMFATPPAPSQLEPNVPEWLDAVVLEALAKDPAARFQSIEALATVLGALPRLNSVRPLAQPVSAEIRPPTTMGRSAGELAPSDTVPTRRGSRALIAAVIGGLAVATGGMALVLSGGERAPAAIAPAASAPVETPPPSAPVETPPPPVRAAPLAPAVPEAAPAAAPPPPRPRQDDAPAADTAGGGAPRPAEVAAEAPPSRSAKKSSGGTRSRTRRPPADTTSPEPPPKPRAGETIDPFEE